MTVQYILVAINLLRLHNNSVQSCVFFVELPSTKMISIAALPSLQKSNLCNTVYRTVIIHLGMCSNVTPNSWIYLLH